MNKLYMCIYIYSKIQLLCKTKDQQTISSYSKPLNFLTNSMLLQELDIYIYIQQIPFPDKSYPS